MQSYSEEDIAAEEERIGAKLPDELRSRFLQGVEDVEFGTDVIELRPGDVLVCVTDGVTERRDDTRMLGEEGLAAVVSTCTGLSAAAVAARIQRAVVSFGSAAPRDDMAILVLRAT